MPFDSSKDAPRLNAQFSTPSRVHYMSVAASRAEGPPADLVAVPAYQIERLGLECALPHNFVMPPAVRATQDPPLREDFCPYTTQWNLDR